MPPQQPRITSPIEAAQGVAATDVHLEASPFADSDGDRAREAEWEIWDIKTDSRAWRATANGVELSHVHLSNGRFEGPLAAIRNLDFDRPYRARVRYRDDSGDPATEWSAWAEWRNFRTAPFGIPPLLAGAAAAEPEVEWTDTTGAAIEPPAGLTVVLRQAPCAECEGFTDLLEWDGFTADVAALAEPADGALQIVLRNAGSERLELPASNLALTLWSEAGEQRSTLYLPALSIVAGGESRLWLARNGATFFALLSETSANFQRPARETEQAWVTLPGFTVEEVGAGLRFPTQVIASGCSARSPSAPAAAHQRRSESGRYSEGQLAPACDAELLVMELKGRIWAIDSRGAKRIYADNLLDFSSPNPNGNSGQVGLGGMAYDPGSGELFVTRTYRAPAAPIRWDLDTELPGWRIFLPSTAAWSDGDRKTKVVRYLDVTESPEAWSISARIQYPTINGAPRWTDGTAFGLVAYRDGHNAVFFNFQSNRHLIESLTGNVRRLEREATATQLAGWLRIAYTAGRMEFYYRASTEAQWSLVESIDDLPFVPTRIGINARNFFNLIGTATFSDIEIDGAAIDPAKLADDTDDPRPTWLHNQVIRVTDDDGDGIAESVATVFDMPDDVSHESHQIQDIEIAADGTLIVSVGDGFDFTKARDTSTFLGKILRLARDGSAPSDNPFYDPEQPAAPISYIYNAGVRNTFGLALRRSDKRLFASENGPSRDRIFAPEAGWDMGYDGSDRSMLTHALLTWAPAVVPVGIEVMQSGAFPQHDDWIFVATAGQDFTLGTSKTGKRILMLRVDAEGKLVEGPIELLRYEGSARTTVIGLAAAPDGLYFTTLYNTDPTADAFNNARLLRIRPSAVAPSL